MKLCPCGSGLERFELVDAAGIFCTFVCDDCEAGKRARYNPAIFDERGRYAMSGEENDIDVDTDSDEEATHCCGACGEASRPTETTWQQWLCPCCGAWNDKEEERFCETHQTYGCRCQQDEETYSYEPPKRLYQVTLTRTVIETVQINIWAADAELAEAEARRNASGHEWETLTDADTDITAEVEEIEQ